MMGVNKAKEAFETWATINIHRIHADALDEAAMGFAAGWDAAEEGRLLLTPDEAQQVQEALDSFPAGAAPVGDEGGWVYIKDWERCAELAETALALLDQSPKTGSAT